MKTYKLLLMLASTLCMASCQEDVFEVGNITDEVKNVTMPMAKLRSGDGSAYFSTVEVVTADTTVALHIELDKPSKTNISGALAYGDASAVEQYNATYGTSYEVFPESLVTFDDPAVVIAGKSKSTDAVLNISVDETIAHDVTYVIPVTVATDDANVTLAGGNHLVFVKNKVGIHQCSEKPNGYKIFSCMETGTANPLFHLAFELESSGAPLFDYVIVFSSKVRWDVDAQAIKIEPCNCQEAISANYEKFIKPLHDRGIKVILSILSTGEKDTGMCFSCIEESRSKEVAKMIADYCNTHHLDGVFFDEEYGVKRDDIPGVSYYPSYQQTSRLLYETKMAMPDKEVIAYNYSYTSRLYTVDGVDPQDYIDWVLNDYQSWSAGSYDGGMPKSKMTPCSMNCANSYYSRWTATESNLNRLKNEGWGGFMIYCFDYAIGNWEDYQWPYTQNVAKYLFDDDLVDTGYRPVAEW